MTEEIRVDKQNRKKRTVSSVKQMNLIIYFIILIVYNTYDVVFCLVLSSFLFKLRPNDPKIPQIATDVKWIVVLYLVSHHLIYQYFAIAEFILFFFLTKQCKIGVSTPGFGPKKGLRGTIISHVYTEVNQIDVLYLLTHHLSIFCHCRIYFGLFPTK